MSDFKNFILDKLSRIKKYNIDKDKLNNKKYESDKKIKITKRKMLIIKLFFSIMFASLFIVLTKVKITPILGTESSFSASVMFGPIISKFLGISFGSSSIIFAHIFGVIVGIYKLKSIFSYFIFLPIIIAGIYFARIFKNEKKLLWIPLACISLFILHPIGREVWFYSLFWTIPLFFVIAKDRIDRISKNYVARVYLYSLATAFIDHCVGSVLYLYLMNIPKEFWIMAIPLTIIERIIIALGITVSYFFVRISISALKEVFSAIAILEAEEEKEKIPISSKYRGKIKNE